MSDNNQVQLNPAEIQQLDNFRRQKNTAVLTIMFTDIKGFTQMTEEQGDEYSTKVRQLHDEILVSTITENDAGMVIKHIGDAIMAVFAEPSAAVEKAMLIQARIAQLNQQRNKELPIEVRIGLDMGQVTLEDNISQDVFGRHVNRASRVEGLADGGQVYLSHIVFDSAKGWLQSVDTLAWQSHGQYQLKGIADPLEIIEVFNPQTQTAKAPEKGVPIKKQQHLSINKWFIVSSVALTLVLVSYFFLFQPAKVWLLDYMPPKSYLNLQEQVVLDGIENSNRKKLINQLSPGKHLLHYTVAESVRYYAEINIESGDNFIKPKFVEHRLPSVYRYNKAGQTTEFNQAFEYETYNEQLGKSQHQTNIQLSITTLTDKNEFAVNWSVNKDGQNISQEKLNLIYDANSNIRQEKTFDIYADKQHQYLVYYRIIKDMFYLEIKAVYQPLNIK